MAKKPQEDTSQLSTAYFEDEMKTSYLNYAYSVITSRAIPDARDGMKPVHRRILYAMTELNLGFDKKTRKSARMVGDVLGKYHPHGDSSVYMAAVKMTQEFSIRYPLIIGQGNFGSIDNDPPAAMRYTEMKLSKVAGYMMQDINKNTVDFGPNFDETLKEPKLLPGKFPNLLCNGTSGIAVGFATDVPPHNLSEVIAGVEAYMKNNDISVAELMEYIPGPDFPTHGYITNRSDMQSIYETGHGSIHLAGKVHYEEKGTQRMLVITEIPYRVVKSKLVEDITSLILDNKNKYSLILKEVKTVRDESSKDGMRVVIILSKDADADSIKSILYNRTALTSRVKVNTVVLVKNQPRVLSLKDMIKHFLEHQRDILIRRTKFDLDKAEKRIHIVEGLLIALANIDEVIKVIKQSKDTADARKNLMAKFVLSEIQSQAILDMRLQKLTSLEVKKLQDEKEELEKLIKYLKSILEDASLRDEVILKELKEMTDDIGDERRTNFDTIETDKIDAEELIKNDPMLLTVSKKGFLIREVGPTTIKTSSRGSKGRKGDATDTDKLEVDDYIFDTVSGQLKDTVLFVTDKGRVYSIKGYEIKGAKDGKLTRGHIRNIERLTQIEENGEEITSVLMVSEFRKDDYILFITAMGKIARISLDNFDNVYRTGINAMRLRENDSVAGAVITNGKQKIFVVKRNGKGFKLDENKIPTYNRGVGGAIGTKVDSVADAVIGMGISEKGKYVVFITSDGKGRKLSPEKFPEMANRGAKGYKLLDMGKNRELASFAICEIEDAIVITTTHGRRISFPATTLKSNLLKLIDLREGDSVSAISTIKYGGEVEDSDA